MNNNDETALRVVIADDEALGRERATVMDPTLTDDPAVTL